MLTCFINIRIKFNLLYLFKNENTVVLVRR